MVENNVQKRLFSISLVMIGFAASLWGLDGVVLTPRLSNLNVLLVVFLLHALPFAVMNLFWFKRYSLLKTFDRKTVFSLVWVSVFGGALGTIAIVHALFLVNFQQLSVVVLLQKFQPIFAVVLATIFLKEQLTKNFMLWGLLAVVGGYFLTFGFQMPHIAISNQTAKAALYSLLASFSFASSTVFSKNILAQTDYISATFFRYGTTSVLMFFVVLIAGQFSGIQHSTTENWLIFAIISVTTGTGAILLYYYGLKYVKASYAILMELFFPITTIVLDYFVNHNVLSPLQWVSASVMVFAILKASLSKSTH